MSGFFMASFDTQQAAADTAINNGNSAINNFNPTASANSVRGGFDTLTTGQQNTGQGFANIYSNAVKSNPSVTSLYDDANNAFNVPALANKANYLNTQVTNQLPLQTQLMRGFDASQGQIDNSTNMALRFLDPQATAATNASQTAQNLAGQRVQAGITQNQMNLLPIQSQQQMLQQTLAGQMTGYNTAAANELNGLIEKMKSGVALSQSELDRANQLAALSEQYNQAVTTANIGQQYKTLAPADTLYNTQNNTKFTPIGFNNLNPNMAFPYKTT